MNYCGNYFPKGSYIRHHGIPGMHWGVRRYQNEDGSLTDEGRVRYAYAAEGDDPVREKYNIKDNRRLSDDELKKRTNRLSLEKQYRNVTANQANRSKSWKEKEVYNLSDEELDRRLARLNKEKQYKELTQNPIKRELKAAAKAILVTAAVTSLTAVAKANYMSAFKPMVVPQSAAQKAHVPYKSGRTG